MDSRDDTHADTERREQDITMEAAPTASQPPDKAPATTSTNRDTVDTSTREDHSAREVQPSPRRPPRREDDTRNKAAVKREVREAQEAQKAAEERERRVTADLRKWQEEYQNLAVHFQGTMQNHARELEQLSQERHAFAAQRRELEETRQLLETRTSELRDAQSYLAKTDSVSHTNVLSVVQNVNAEILQVCGQITDAYTFGAPSSGGNSNANEESAALTAAHSRVTLVLGNEAENMLYHVRRGTYDAACVQMALQTLFSRCAELVASAWEVDFGRAWDMLSQQVPAGTTHSPFQAVHDSMVQSETQAVSARWRMLTRQYTQRPNANSTSLDTLRTKILDDMSAVLVLAGARESPKSEQSHSSNFNAAAEKLKTIFSLCLKLREYMGERVSSSDFRVICPRPHADFRPEWMEDVCAPRGSKPAAGKVVFVTELGLGRREKLSNSAPGRASLVEAVPARAGVVLTTSVSEFLTGSDAM